MRWGKAKKECVSLGENAKKGNESELEVRVAQ